MIVRRGWEDLSPEEKEGLIAVAGEVEDEEEEEEKKKREEREKPSGDDCERGLGGRG
jgi:hypothetical protein